MRERRRQRRAEAEQRVQHEHGLVDRAGMERGGQGIQRWDREAEASPASRRGQKQSVRERVLVHYYPARDQQHHRGQVRQQAGQVDRLLAEPA